MVTIKEVGSGKELKEYIQFPVDLYKDNKYYVPSLFGDELNIFTPKKSPYLDQADVKLFLAYKDGKLAGRAGGIILHPANKKFNEKRVRLTRIDFIDDTEVSEKLIQAVSDWGISQGMDTIYGPLGFNDLDKEGLLIEGFNELSTFETYYNFEYYQKHFERLDFVKDNDWIEYEIKVPDKVPERHQRLSQAVMKRTGLREVQGLSKGQLIKRYGSQILDVLDKAYENIYGAIPLSEKARKGIISQFKLVLNIDYISVLIDKDDKVVAFGLAVPSIAKAVQKSRGKLFPLGAFRILHALKNHNRIDFCLIGVVPEYANSGAPAIIFNNMTSRLIKNPNLKFGESNPQMETNYKMHALFGNYETRRHRRRRCYIKQLKK
ncbi:MAG: N-acetyltransferase [Firmicutes bacterium]|nr:N-acetyltransferase [Bacillota bacterium]